MRTTLVIGLCFCIVSAYAQPSYDTTWWHGKERTIHYRPQGTDFVIENGKRRFVRALYGSNTAFRVEAGDLPEFALYMPGMGGNFKFGIIAGNKSKWLIDAQYIKAIYRPGSMIYEIKDSILGKGVIRINVIGLYDREGMIVKINSENTPKLVSLMAVFGGATGKKFSRDGDIGADPESSFYLKPENCTDNIYSIFRNSFHLAYGFEKPLSEEERYEIDHRNVQQSDIKLTDKAKKILGCFPEGSQIRRRDASSQNSPLALLGSDSLSKYPLLVSVNQLARANTNYYLIQKDFKIDEEGEMYYTELPKIFQKAEVERNKIASRIKISTPDKYINTIGGALSIAADAIWEDPSYLHGAIAWRMRLNAWRGAYVADPLGWHDRARKHFSSYALSQVKTVPVTGVVMDTALHLARHLEKIGTALFSDGYICRNPNGDIRAHHYDMNLVFVDQLLNHFNWTGDTAYVKEMWPLIKRHLAWEKRNFDTDGDGLYDAYAAIWASDALQYSGGGVTHSSAYNYRANKTAAELAKLIGEDGAKYQQEADKIFNAIQKNLWLPEQGSYAEYKDLLGKQLVHPSPGLWTIYHAIDSKVPDPFQAYLNLRYVDNHIPHIPIKAKGLDEKGLYLLSTTNWQPYTWSINNVALGENLHTALAYWQGNRPDEAFRLWRSTLIESMYLGASPGGFQQLSFYDAIRGELYRDFADGIGMAGRTLVEGLFGIQPDALHDTLTIQPGYPAEWNYAGVTTPDLYFDFKRSGYADTYIIKQSFRKNLALKFLVTATRDGISRVTVNGIPVHWAVYNESVGRPMLVIKAMPAKQYNIVISWQGRPIGKFDNEYLSGRKEHFRVILPGMSASAIYDPQQAVDSLQIKQGEITGVLVNLLSATFFVKLKQGSFEWWQPVNLGYKFNAESFLSLPDSMYITVNRKQVIEKLDLVPYYNDKVTNIFKHQYLSPRPTSPALQLPTQGIGNWCYPLTTANIDDSGVRRSAGDTNEIRYKDGISFATPSDTLLNNVVFASQWDNFPDSVIIPLSGSGSEIYLLMAGTTNPMQSHITNGMVIVSYGDNSADTLLLRNPGNWWPIEQDYYIDGYAFNACCELPDRLYFKEGKFAKELPAYTTIRGFSNRAIDGGAGTVLSMFLDSGKELKALTVQAVANDVVIGLMAATLVR